jgi:hypothetical protein
MDAINATHRPHRRQQNTSSPPLAGSGPEITGANEQQAALAGGNMPQTSLPSSAPGGGGVGTQTPVVPNADQESRAGGGTPFREDFDPGTLAQDRGDPNTYMATNLPDKTGTDFAVGAAETAGIRTLDKVKDPESAAQVAAVSAQMGIETEADADSIRSMFGDKYKELTKAKVEDGELTPAQKKKQDKRFTNVFGGMTKQELGMFLFEYGAIMMANGDKGLGGAAGMAGIGSLASLQERRRYAEQAEVEATERKRKADLEERRVAVTEDRLEHDVEKAGRDAPDTITTEDGVLQWNPETGQYDTWVTDPETGEKVKPSTMAGKPSTKEWEINWLVKNMGLSKEEAGRRVFSGVDPNNVRMMAEERWARFMADADAVLDYPGGTIQQSRIKRMSGPEVAKIKRDFVNGVLKGFGYGDYQGSALGGEGGGGGGALPDIPRPEGMSDEDYRKLQEIEAETRALEGS